MDVEDIYYKVKPIVSGLRDERDDAFAEIMQNLSGKTTGEIRSIIFSSIQSLQVTLEKLKKDFEIDDNASRYFSRPHLNDGLLNIRDTIIKYKKGYHLADSLVKIEEVYSAEYEILELRLKILSGFIMSLTCIGNDFIIRLERLLKKAIPSDAKFETSSSKLTTNQIVLLLDQIGLFRTDQLEDCTIRKKAQVLNLLTGTNQKNLEKFLGKLEKSPQKNGKNYQADMEKITKSLSEILK